MGRMGRPMLPQHTQGPANAASLPTVRATTGTLDGCERTSARRTT
jgi:hypothetical protein